MRAATRQVTAPPATLALRPSPNPVDASWTSRREPGPPSRGIRFENLSDPEAALSCVEVFALGGRAGSADASESGYFAVRGVLAKTVTEAARFVAERGVLKEGAPILLKFVTQVAARFGLVVTQKVAAQALPIVGGAAVNYAFIGHFQDIARGHFTVRRLERVYGRDRIRSEYDLIAREL
jgi:hypothetical protein